MLSHLHATLAEMFRHRPTLAVEVLTDVLGVPLPVHRKVRAGTSDVVTLRATEHRADAVVLLGDEQETVGAVVVEVQLRVDEEKRWTWPLYVASVRQRQRCPTLLLVLCPDEATARWASRPLALGNPGSHLLPAVLGPEVVPVIDDPDAAARSPELTVLSVLAHARDETVLGSLDVLVEALSTISADLAVEYAHVVLGALPDLARAHLEELMSTQTYRYQSDFTRRLRAEEAAVILLRVLARRGLEVPDEARARITGCSDPAQLEAWIDAAVTATSIEDVLGGS